MTPARRRIEKYRNEGGAADLARVEVLVPSADRDKIIALAAQLRRQHRSKKELRTLFDDALRLYRTRVLDNIDIDRLPDFGSRAAVVARALMDRGDARAFSMGRKMLDHLEPTAQ